MASTTKAATVAAFIESAPPGEVGRKRPLVVLPSRVLMKAVM